MGQFVYKLFHTSEWLQVDYAGKFSGSPDDRRDGFIHLSAAEQVRATFTKYFAGEAEPVLVGFAAERFGTTLRWEISRNGESFPHLYGLLDLSLAVSIFKIRRDANGTPGFPAEIP
jgi:uncharacterized protein (DUF952 family)